LEDEIIIPALTFVSDANVVRQLGAEPIFADSISLSNFNVSEDDIIKKITSRTKAIVVVHFAGHPQRFDKLARLAKKRNIPIIEDCAHAPGASIGDFKCGSIGDFSFFSFFSNKNLATGEGGMVFAKDPEISKKIRLMRSHGMTAVTFDRHEGRTSSYDVVVSGLNYRADEIRAALGLEQLKKLPNGNIKRKILFERYVKNLKNSVIGIPFTEREQNYVSAYHIMPIILPDDVVRDEVMLNLKKHRVQTSIHYPSFKSFSMYADSLNDFYLPVSDEICRKELTLPLHPRMTLEDVDKVSKLLLEVV
jgi:dTDP-4-amino-4,6-dideoxygalactose transaminase